MATRFLLVVLALLPAVARAQVVNPAFVRQVTVGEVVTGLPLTLCEYGVLALTPPADGMLQIRVTWDPGDGGFEVRFASEKYFWSDTGSLIATQVVAAGQKTTLSVYFTGGGWECYDSIRRSFTVEISMISSSACGYAVSRTFVEITEKGGQGSINVIASNPGCDWTASEAADWLTLLDRGSRGTGVVRFVAGANSSTKSRYVTLTIAGQSVYLAQSGVPSAPCTYSVSRTLAGVTWEGGQGSVSVDTSNPECDWTALEAVDWVTLVETRFRGPGVVTFEVLTNSAMQSRSATLKIAGESVRIEQTGTPDEDGDGLPTPWEVQFGLDSNNSSSAHGPNGDPDGDGKSNRDELLAGTHPRGLFTQYFAEGVTSDFFDLRLAFLNPGSSVAHALVYFRTTAGTTENHALEVPPRAVRALNPKTLPLMNRAEFSTVVESDLPLVADRTVTWDATAYGGHAETSIAQPSLQWYLAEGSTYKGLNLFYLLQNPNTTESRALVRYLRPAGPPLEKTYVLPPNSRTTIWVNEEEFAGFGKALSSSDVSAAIEVTNGPPIIVERAMYLSTAGQAFGAGHESAGVTAPALQWFLAEGATGPFFDSFVLLANPGSTDAIVEATYFLADGAVITKPYTVTANSRFTIWVDFDDPRLADTAVSTTIRSTNNVPIIVERAMWWPDGDWYEAHNSPGATATGTRWALAEGEVGGSRGTETYVLLANTSATAGTVKVTLLFEDGSTAEKTFAVPANSRFNVNARGEFPAALDRRFGVLVESQGQTPAQLVVERAMYWNALGQVWAAGTNALATRLQ